MIFGHVQRWSPDDADDNCRRCGVSFAEPSGWANKNNERPNMKAAITELEIALQTMETNEPINRIEGKTEQADLEAKNAAEIRQALAVLRAADAGPIWPAPKA